jgi:inner membrane protein
MSLGAMSPMSPITHLLVGWAVANTASLDPKERAWITIAAVVPDVDGLGAVAEVLTRNSDEPLEWWSRYHHVLGHNIGFALVVAAIVWLLSTRRWLTAALAFSSFHLHLLGDIVGGRGPDGYQWPIPYLLPFSDRWHVTWEGQWALNAWPNFVVTAIFLGLTFHLAWRRGFSPLEMISPSANSALVRTLRQRFGHPQRTPSKAV